MPALALAESAILTALLTHGFIVAIILCALAPRDLPDRDDPKGIPTVPSARPPRRLGPAPGTTRVPSTPQRVRSG
jgi:hypothetical protein